MFQEPMVWKVSEKIDRSIIISIITVKFSISKYHCQTESAVIFKAQWDTESHLHMYKSLVAVGENATSPCDIPLQSKVLT